MAMTLRLSPDDAAVLAQLADVEGRSQNEVMIQALHDYAERRGREQLLEKVIDAQLPRYAEALERLGQ